MPFQQLKLDKSDRKILVELETDARQSASSIAKKARLSEQVVNYRIRKYLSSGLIAKFFAIPNYEKLGFTTYRIYLQFRAATAAQEEEIIAHVRDGMPCQWLGVCDGRWDLIARISARDIFDFNRMMDAFLERYGEHIRQKEVTVQLRHTWWPSTYGLGAKAREKTPRHEVPKKASLVKHDDKDLKILAELIEDARLPTVEIASRVGLSPDAVQYRMRHLQKSGAIINMKCSFNREMTGYRHNQVFVRFQQNPEGIARFLAFLGAYEPCFFVSSMVGAWDAQFGIDAKSSVEFHELLSQVKEKFSDVIAEYETLIVYREYAPNPFGHFSEK
ncbi:MAG: Lrp/AsnC family transcriptional regulator [Candidatus Micrarchaeia archaeon]|jgi:Lrp/AsnC family transcriptional regulator